EPGLNDDELSPMEPRKDELTMPPKQTLGKGKRARIPNKRYSDIMITSPKLEKIRKFENGDMQDNITEKENAADSENTVISTLKIARNSMSSPSPHFKRVKLPVDLSNPNFLKPFQFGWKRELVYRATTDSSAKRNGDIYYYTPHGKKVRSMREVSENLKNKELTLDDFTFYKEPLGLEDPEKEIIRDAKVKFKEHPSKTSSRLKVSSPKLPPLPPAPAPTLPAVSPVNDSPKSTKNLTKTGGGFKVKLPSKGTTPKGKIDKKQKENDAEMEVGTYPPNWNAAQPKAKTTTTKWGNKRMVRRSKAPNKPKLPPTTAEDKSSNLRMDSKFMENYLQNLAYGYGTLLYVFQYLKVQDLLRAGCVCTMWRDVANHPILWRTVRMKNSQIHSFEGLADTLQKHGTVNLDLRKMLLPNGGDDLWPSFSSAISKVDSLRKIELCRCPAVVVEQLATTNPKLEVINAVTIKCETMSLNSFVNVVSLQELRLKSTAGLSLTSDLSAIKELKHLKHLSLTSIKDLNRLNIDVIADLSNLESLDLGECTDFPNTFGSGILTRLEKLEKLRLEKGQGTCYTFEILEAVKNMPKLEQLELVNFDIKSGFDKALGACTNIKKLLIIPTYISQSATTNHMVLGGVLRLQSTLSHFVWGVTLELLRVTELFVDQCEDSEKKDKKERKPAGNGDSIPVLKPVPFLGELSEQTPQTTEPPQVEILPLPNLQKLLLQNLPTTRVKILKIPFHATWRQTITDTVN
ncbi:F-box domain-containing protein, partial [Oryctes borbonicus]